MYQQNDDFQVPRPIENVLSRLKDYNKTGDNQWQSLCPAHADKNASLSISMGNADSVLLYCHAGCNLADICLAIGLTEADLFLSTEVTKKQPSMLKKSSIDWDSLVKRFAIDIDHPRLLELSSKLGVVPESLIAIGVGWHSVEEVWTHPEYDASGHVIGIILRPRSGKKYSIKGGHRGITIPKNPDAETGPILVVEGQSDVAAALSMGLRVIGMPGTSGGKADEFLLALLKKEKRCLIVGDNDPAGHKAAKRRATFLSEGVGWEVTHSTPPTGCKDTRQYLLDRKARNEHDYITAGSDYLVHLQQTQEANSVDDCESGGKDGPGKHEPILDVFKPFPVDAFPEPVRSFVIQGAKAIGCDTSYLALPMLSALASAIGNTQRIQLKRNWTEPAIIWTAIVGDSGTMKSPAIELALRAIRKRQRKAMAEYKIKMSKYHEELVLHKH